MGKKVKLKHIEDAEERANSQGMNLGDLDGFTTQYIYPSKKDTRRKYEKRFKEIEEFNNDLFDSDVEVETFFKNIKPRFTEKISLEEYDLLNDDDKIEYHEFLLSLAEKNE